MVSRSGVSPSRPSDFVRRLFAAWALLAVAAAQAADGHPLVWNSNSISIAYHTVMLPSDYRAFTPAAPVVRTLGLRPDAK
jgi:hypothetical protein